MCARARLSCAFHAACNLSQSCYSLRYVRRVCVRVANTHFVSVCTLRSFHLNATRYICGMLAVCWLCKIYICDKKSVVFIILNKRCLTFGQGTTNNKQSPRLTLTADHVSYLFRMVLGKLQNYWRVSQACHSHVSRESSAGVRAWVADNGVSLSVPDPQTIRLTADSDLPAQWSCTLRVWC